MQKQGIQQTKELLAFLLDTFSALKESVEDDGKITRRDIPNFLSLGWSAPTAIGGAQDVVREFGDLDESEKEELMELARARFDIPNDQLEYLIETTFSVMISVADLGAEWVKYSRRSK